MLRVGHDVKPGESTEFMLKGHTASCLTVELSPTGRYLATGGADSIISLFDTKDWICQRTVTRMVGPVKSISTVQPHVNILFLGYSANSTFACRFYI